jgi:DNA modification methylase
MSTIVHHGDYRDLLPTLGHIDAVVTDPPYGDDHDTDYTRFSGGKLKKSGAEKPRHRYRPILGDAVEFDPSPLLPLARHVVLFGANRFANRLPCGTWFVWDKRTPGGSKGVMSDGEAAWYSRGRGLYIFAHHWDGFNRASERGTRHHPTQKPVALMRWVLTRLRLPEGATVFDPFAGSGPVGVACAGLGLNYIGIEREAVYVEIARKRIADAESQLTLAGVA